ncbi:hypothetical protein M441DRAFT_316586 [Trichoderma asperellum CBS 433.97]|uniref:Uncharacterized protein n=1 Tax=Trichoderma asperellum (strain ATCC 204424 / CBS 433.97 / NBRC 101777) TaxID=1042311 RepID=A0A2T3ZKR7_TRIA4|nr:hypothetical protein M441DRAFT_316586 [Trichoderma asperellum CBS 433.97]PTB45400.1 hypothetical protein M441DRAFT_316586 [Trichoderma asperellum CBS 433.97]
MDEWKRQSGWQAHPSITSPQVPPSSASLPLTVAASPGNLNLPRDNGILRGSANCLTQSFFCLFLLCHCALFCFIAIAPRSLPIYSQASSACCLYNCRISRRRLTFLQSIVPNSVPSIAQNVCESPFVQFPSKTYTAPAIDECYKTLLPTLISTFLFLPRPSLKQSFLHN